MLLILASEQIFILFFNSGYNIVFKSLSMSSFRADAIINFSAGTRLDWESCKAASGLIVEQISEFFHRNLSLLETSTKIGTDTL